MASHWCWTIARIYRKAALWPSLNWTRTPMLDFTLVLPAQRAANQHGAPIWNLKHRQTQIFDSIVHPKPPPSLVNPVIFQQICIFHCSSNICLRLNEVPLSLCSFIPSADAPKLTKWVKLPRSVSHTQREKNSLSWVFCKPPLPKVNYLFILLTTLSIRLWFYPLFNCAQNVSVFNLIWCETEMNGEHEFSVFVWISANSSNGKTAIEKSLEKSLSSIRMCVCLRVCRNFSAIWSVDTYLAFGLLCFALFCLSMFAAQSIGRSIPCSENHSTNLIFKQNTTKKFNSAKHLRHIHRKCCRSVRLRANMKHIFWLF